MRDRPESAFPAGTNRRSWATCRTWANRFLLVVAAVLLAFLTWNMFFHGTAVREDPAFRAWAGGLLLALCAAVAWSLSAEAGHAWQEGLERRESPPAPGASSVRTRSFRFAGPAETLLRHCTGHLARHFPRFYAFHRYQAPHVAYLFHAKKGSLALLGLPWARAGFLLMFLAGYVFIARGDFQEIRAWEAATLCAAGFLVATGLFFRAAVSYRKVWLRFVEENDRLCLTLTFRGPSGDRWFDALCDSIETQAGAVSCSSQSR